MKLLGRIWAATLSALAVMCLSLSLVAPAIFPSVGKPQTFPVIQEQQAEQDRRIAGLEGIQADHRLTVMETSLEEIRWEVRAVLGGLGGLLLEAVWRFARKGRA